MNEKWLYNQWYCAMYSKDLPPGGVEARTVLEEAIVLWRGQDNVIQALEDRCPHRYAPLSMGKQIGQNRIRCIYHGLEFDGQGICVHNPHGEHKLPPSTALKVYPVHEYAGIVWLWMGSEEPDLSLLPDLTNYIPELSPYDVGPPQWLTLDVPFELVIDNLMDLSHAALLHEGIIGNEDTLAGETHTEKQGEMICSYRFMPNVRPPEYFDLIFKNDGSRIDMWSNASWQAPGNISLDIGCTNVGKPREEGTGVLAHHILTPVTETSCMYHFLGARVNPPSHQKDENEKIQKRLAELRIMAFSQQDGPMIKAQFDVIKRMGGFRPMILPDIDKGPAWWRKSYKRMISDQNKSK